MRGGPTRGRERRSREELIRRGNDKMLPKLPLKVARAWLVSESAFGLLAPMSCILQRCGSHDFVVGVAIVITVLTSGPLQILCGVSPWIRPVEVANRMRPWCNFEPRIFAASHGCQQTRGSVALRMPSLRLLSLLDQPRHVVALRG